MQGVHRDGSLLLCRQAEQNRCGWTISTKCLSRHICLGRGLPPCTCLKLCRCFLPCSCSAQSCIQQQGHAAVNRWEWWKSSIARSVTDRKAVCSALGCNTQGSAVHPRIQPRRCCVRWQHLMSCKHAVMTQSVDLVVKLLTAEVACT